MIKTKPERKNFFTLLPQNLFKIVTHFGLFHDGSKVIMYNSVEVGQSKKRMRSNI